MILLRRSRAASSTPLLALVPLCHVRWNICELFSSSQGVPSTVLSSLSSCTGPVRTELLPQLQHSEAPDCAGLRGIWVHLDLWAGIVGLMLLVCQILGFFPDWDTFLGRFRKLEPPKQNPRSSQYGHVPALQGKVSCVTHTALLTVSPSTGICSHHASHSSGGTWQGQVQCGHVPNVNVCLSSCLCGFVWVWTEPGSLHSLRPVLCLCFQWGLEDSPISGVHPEGVWAAAASWCPPALPGKGAGRWEEQDRCVGGCQWGQGWLWCAAMASGVQLGTRHFYSP